jgi:uncharacterized protein YndB with AHSA1/START domain
MTTATTVPAIERRWELAAPRERVWRALADPAELAAWFCARIDFAPVAGHEGWFEFEGHGRVMVRVEVVEAPHRLAWRWAHVPGIALDAAPSTLVEWTLDEAPGGGTVVGLRESGFRRNEDRLSNVGGWDPAHLRPSVVAGARLARLLGSSRARGVVGRHGSGRDPCGL